MKGLLLKDFYTLVKQLKIFLLLIVIFAVLPDSNLSNFAVVYAALLPITALAYDERSHWDTLAAMLPYSSRSLVQSKYLLGYLLTAAAALLSLVTQLVASAVQHAPMPSESGFSLLLIFCIALLFLAVSLPIISRLGVEKGRIAFLIMIVATVSLGMSLRDSLSSLLTVSPASLPVFPAILIGGTAAANLLSMAISIRIYRKRMR